MNIPKDLKYTEDHEWVKIEGEEAIIGITSFAQSELGDIVFVEIDSEGDTIEKSEVFGTVEAVKTVSDLYMPLSGEILSYNSELDNSEFNLPTNIFDNKDNFENTIYIKDDLDSINLVDINAFNDDKKKIRVMNEEILDLKLKD